MSRLYLHAKNIGGKTVIAESEFTAPIKIAKPFYRADHTEIMMMTASAGILDGDEYDITIAAAENTSLKFTAQSYTKLFAMDKLGASQTVSITAERGARLCYMPCPVIPFGGSRFTSLTQIRLDRSAVFAMCDIISCGRAAMNERFRFDSYRSRTAVYVDERLVFLDNQRLVPSETELSSTGFFEGHSHMGMIYLYGAELSDIPLDTQNIPFETGITRAAEGICIRMAADSADEAERLAKSVCMSIFG